MLFYKSFDLTQILLSTRILHHSHTNTVSPYVRIEVSQK